MLRYLICLAFSLALVAAGCGDKKGETDTTPSSASKEATPAENGPPPLKDGWKEIKAAGFQLAVPDDWTPVDLTAENIDKMIDEAAKANEGVRMQAAQFKQLATNGMVKLMVFGQVDPTGPFAENLNVVVTDSPTTPTADQLAEAYKSQITPMATAGTTPSGGPNKLPVADGVKMKSDLALGSGGTKSVASLAFMFAKGGKMYTVTFSSLPGRAAEIEKLADEIMQSFRVD